MAKKFKPGDKEIYENVFDGLSFYQTTGEVYHTNRSKKKFHDLFKSATKNISSPKVLDVGCFVGTELFMLPKVKGGEYVGVDVSTDAISYAKKLAQKRGEKQIKFMAVDANGKLPFKNNYFDVIYALELVEHLHDPSIFFEEAKRILKPNGRIILSTPNGETLMNKIASLVPQSLSQNMAGARELDFSRHGNSFKVASSDWDNEAHISLHGYSKWKTIFAKNKLTIDAFEGSSFFGGSRYISERPFLLGIAILLDSIIDLLPFKPHMQMCLLVSLKKSTS